MLKLKILNSKESKEILSIIDAQWGFEGKLDYAFLVNTKNRIFIINREVGRVDFSSLRINSMGLYFGELKDGVLRLTIEGSQVVGPHSKKNVVEITDDELQKWLRGVDLVKDCEGCRGFVIVRHGTDYIGCGRYSNGMITNFVPKTRRINSVE